MEIKIYINAMKCAVIVMCLLALTVPCKADESDTTTTSSFLDDIDWRAGMVYHGDDISPLFAATIYRRPATEYRDWTLDVGVANNYIYSAIGIEVVPIVSITTFISAGYDIQNKSIEAGIGVTIIRF